MKEYDKNKESSYLKYWNGKNLYGWTMSQKLPVNKFEWIEETHDFLMTYHFYQKERKSKK